MSSETANKKLKNEKKGKETSIEKNAKRNSEAKQRSETVKRNSEAKQQLRSKTKNEKKEGKGLLKKCEAKQRRETKQQK